MKFLRTVSTQRLLAIVAGLIIAVAGGTAIAVAAAGGGAVPPREPLAQAPPPGRHGADASSGITARITFTNNLIDSTDIQGSDPILTGASGRLWLSHDHASLRLELQGDNGDAQVVVKNGAFSIYDPTVEHRLQGHAARRRRLADSARPADRARSRSVAQIQTAAEPADAAASTSPAPTPARRRRPAGLQGRALAQARRRAARRRPARLGRGARRPAAASRSTRAAVSTPVLELKATDISFGPVSAERLHDQPAGRGQGRQDLAPAAHAAPATARKRERRPAARAKAHAEVTGPAAVQAHLPFTLAAPEQARRPPAPVGPAARLGRTPGGARHLRPGPRRDRGDRADRARARRASSRVAERRRPARPQPPDRVDQRASPGRSSPPRSEPSCASRPAGVAYTVLGSVPPTAAESAARQLAP